MVESDNGRDVRYSESSTEVSGEGRCTRGEGRCTKEDDDKRSAGQKDHDRVLYCGEFQRLGGITQVVGSHEGRVFHNRLMHSLKAGTLARRIAEILKKEPLHVQDVISKLGGLDLDVVETAALAHDIGHPPFGHTGENQLNELVKAKDGEGFEGNAQAFRILTKNAPHHDKFGLDLTRATLRAVLKYPRLQDKSPESQSSKKYGAYESEKEFFDFAMELPVQKKMEKERSLEAAIMNWADDITYAVHDLYDFCLSGFIPLSTLIHFGQLSQDNSASKKSGKSEFERFYKSSLSQEKYDGETFRNACSCLFHRLQKSGYFPSLDNTSLEESSAQLRGMQSYLIHNFEKVFVGELCSEGCLSDVKFSEPFNFLEIDIGEEFKWKEAKWYISVLKELTYFYVISNPRLRSQQVGQKKILEVIFHAYYSDLENAFSGGKSAQEQSGIPQKFEKLYEKEKDNLAKCGKYEKRELLARIAADMTASLEEQEAIFLFGRLNGNRIGSVTDLLPHHL